jgi:hypothetical protein
VVLVPLLSFGAGHRGHRNDIGIPFASSSRTRNPDAQKCGSRSWFRKHAVHILDYKPDARTNRPIAQLTVYALALTKLAGLRLFDIKCAWFNEEEYCEFFPRTLLARCRN